MTPSAIAALIWLLVVNLRGMFPSKDHHWRFAYVMIAIGLPILVWVWWQNGVWIALAVLIAAGWVMRWPVIYLGRWVKRRIGGNSH